jgi:hypothetical protein
MESKFSLQCNADEKVVAFDENLAEKRNQI